MTFPIRRLMRRAACAACLVCAFAPRARAQWIAPPPVDPPVHAAFMPRYDFHLSADATASGDDRFSFDTHFGGDIDLVDYKHGRGTILIDYQAILGDQLRPFDPNQGNYLLEVSSSGASRLDRDLRRVSSRVAAFERPGESPGNRVERSAGARAPAAQSRCHHDRPAWRCWQNCPARDGGLRLDRGHRREDYLADQFPLRGLRARVLRDVRRRCPQHARTADGRTRGSGCAAHRQRRRDRALCGYERVVDADAFQALPLSWAFGGFRLTNR